MQPPTRRTHFLRHSLRLCLLALRWALSACATDIKTSGTHAQFVLEASRSAGLALTDADPRMINPDDLLHMREGDVPSVRIHKALQYVGHLKSPPQLVAAGPIGL